MVVAGIVWTVAGVNILRIGIDCWVQVSGGFVLMLLGAVAVFAAFHYMLFSLSRNYPNAPVSAIIEETGVFTWKAGEKTHGMRQSS